MLQGIVVQPLNRLPDERGTFTVVFRKDWEDLLGNDVVSQSNLSTTYPGIIRAWHKHTRGQTDYFIALKGAIKIGVFDEKTGELDEIFSSEENLQVIKVPGNYWHGFKAVGNEPVMLLYFTTNLYDSKSPDEERRPWNDPSIKPISLNGKKDDPRVGKSFDWNQPPHK